MNQTGLFFIVLFLLSTHVKAQNSANHQHGLNPLHPSMAVVTVVLAIMFSVTFFVLAFAKFCRPSLVDHLTHEENLHGLLRSRSRSSGIDKTVIESLPFFRFSSLNGSKEGLECVVCLSKFEDSEILRLLPKCRHAFHMNCIDEWLEGHSTCPLCRYKFDVGDLTNFTYTNSLRYPPNSSNPAEDPNLELFVRREQDHHRSSRFNLGSSFRKLGKAKKDEFLILEGGTKDENRQLLHKFKHRIIVSDIVYNSRWSDVNSSDLMSLNSEMISAISSRRFSPPGFSTNEQIMKIKDDIEKKRLHESKVGKITRSYSVSSSTSTFSPTFNIEENKKAASRTLNPAEKRSMSEITNLSRFPESSIRNRIRESLSLGNNGKDERIRRLWFPIARRTVQWFVGRERRTEESERERQLSNV
ncbi:unnamed protein product [Ilex paraguariensis]|uniref:RING-type E3 ubiquitin transferase n=1 Tax=Ilex paraguariensis TaxID=185542 RepID=A0ABC8RLU1_9AQUA